MTTFGLDPSMLVNMGIDPATGMPLGGGARGGSGALTNAGMIPPPAQTPDSGGDDRDYAHQLSQMDAGSGSQLQQIEAGKSQAYSEKARDLQRAMDVLQAAKGSQSTNLPLLVAAGAMLAPTRTGALSESLGNAFRDAVPVAQQQREREMQYAQTMGNLQTQKADVEIQRQNQATNDFFEQMKLKEQELQSAGYIGARNEATQQRGQIAQIKAQSAADVANINAAAKNYNADQSLQWHEIYANYRNRGLDEKVANDAANLEIKRQNANSTTMNAQTNRAYREAYIGHLQDGDDEKTAHDRATEDVQRQNAGTNQQRAGNQAANDWQQAVARNVTTFSLMPSNMNKTAAEINQMAIEAAKAAGLQQPGAGGAPAQPAGTQKQGAAAPAVKMRPASPADIASAQAALKRGVDRQTLLDHVKANGVTMPDGF